MRLQRMIALSSSLSRRAAEVAITDGRVSVNGVVTTELGTKVHPKKDKVCLDDNLLKIPEECVYVAFNKPCDVIVSKSDEYGRKTIWDILPEFKDELNSVGRLDSDSEGLLLLSNDGDFINKLTHPKHEIWKIYEVKVEGEVTDEAVTNLKEGVELDEGKTLPASIIVLKKTAGISYLEIAIREGRNRQIRRMCEAVGFPVIKLKRTSIGPVKLHKLQSGRWRYLSEDEIAKLIG